MNLTWLDQYQGLLTSFFGMLGVIFGAALAVAGWLVKRLFETSDDHEDRIAELEAEALTKEDLRYLENRLDNDLREIERKVEIAGDKACVRIDDINKRFDMLLHRLADKTESQG